MTTNLSMLNRSLRRLRRAWSELNTTLRGAGRWELDPALPERDVDFLREHIHNCLSMAGGEYARRAEAARIGHAYAALNAEGRLRLLRLLGSDFDTPDEAIDQAIAAWQASRSPARREALRETLASPRVRLLTLLNSLPEGIKFLVDMRSELLDAMGADPVLREVERDLKHLLRSWFDVGFLQLRRLDWNTPAAFLEKLIEYEAVHEITSWQDLKRALPRLQQFATLSPIPGFAAWLQGVPAAETEAALEPAEREALTLAAGTSTAAVSLPELLARPLWHLDDALTQALRPALLRLCARFLVTLDPGGTRARDAVAHFHLGNGAVVAQLNWLADTSAKGMAQSFGIMVNYLYDPQQIDENSENYSRSGQIACTPALRDNPARRRWPWQTRTESAPQTGV